MSFLENSFSDGIFERSGNLAGDIAKGATDQATKNSEGARENALAGLAKNGVNSVVGSLLGEDGDQIIPPQYLNGTTDIEREKVRFADTYSHANNTYFKPVVVDSAYRVEDSHPMTKSLFLVDFEFNTSIADSNRLKSMYRKSMSFLLKNFSWPRADIEVEKLNQYNHHVVVPKRVMYAPITCRFGDIQRTYKEGNDTVSLMDLYKEYMSYYFNDFVNEVKTDGEYKYHFGYASGREEKQFINNISLYFFWADGAKKIRIVNPFIKSFTYDELDYTSDEQLTVTCEIEYEYIDVKDINLTYKEFIDQTNALLETASEGLLDNNITNPYANSDQLQRGIDPVDLQRDVNLDNPVAQSMMRLAEIEAIELAEDSLNSDNPLERVVAEKGVNVATGAVSTGASFLGGLL